MDLLKISRDVGLEAECAELLYETLPLGVIFHDSAGRIISVNPAAALLLDSTVENLTELGWQCLRQHCLSEDGSPFKWQEQLALFARQSVRLTVNVAVKARHPEVDEGRSLEVTTIPLRASGEKWPLHAYTLVRDVTESKKKEELKQEDAISSVLSALNDGFWDWSLANNRIMPSPRLCAMLGYHEADLADEPDLLQRMIHPDDRQRVGQLIREGLEGKRDLIQAECRLKHKLGHSIHVITKIFILRDRTGFVRRVCGTSIDITERLKMEEELLEYQRKLSEANETLERRVMERTEELESAVKELEAFSYSVSHDLRAPLRHINSFSAILKEDFAPEMPVEAVSYLERIGTASNKMGALIDNLLELSRVSRTEISLRPVNLSVVAAELLAVYQEIDPHRVVRTSINKTTPVLGDQTLLRQLLDNLLGNAWKYTSTNPAAHIEFGMTEVGGAEAFFVRDDGVGFDMAHGQRLFKAFERLHGSEFPGLGIGLATSHRIILRHGGRIWADAKPGEGSTFYFTLPIYY